MPPRSGSGIALSVEASEQYRLVALRDKRAGPSEGPWRIWTFDIECWTLDVENNDKASTFNVQRSTFYVQRHAPRRRPLPEYGKREFRLGDSSFTADSSRRR